MVKNIIASAFTILFSEIIGIALPGVNFPILCFDFSKMQFI